MSINQLRNGESGGVMFSSSFGNKEFKLIEVPEDVFELVMSGESLKIVGGGNEEALLCSKDHTYSIKRVESSNSVYFVPPKDGDLFSIESLCSDYYELKPTLAKFDKLHALLCTTQYLGFQEEQLSPIDENLLPSEESLHKSIQASVAELSLYLRTKDVIHVGDKLRLLSKNAVLEATSSLFNTILSEGWSIDMISESFCLSKIVDVDSTVIRHILKFLGSFDGEIWCLDQQKVLSASANLLFNRKYCNEHGKAILVPREDFFEEWSLTTPGVTCSGPAMAEHEHLLRGMALKELSGLNSVMYKFFSISDLSLDPKTRFSQLFAVKPRFQLDELEPYLVGLFGPGGVLPKSQAALLLQHTRSVDNYYILKVL